VARSGAKLYAFTKKDGRKGPPAGNKARCNRSNTPHSKAMQCKAKPNQTPQTNTRGARQPDKTSAETRARLRIGIRPAALVATYTPNRHMDATDGNVTHHKPAREHEHDIPPGPGPRGGGTRREPNYNRFLYSAASASLSFGRLGAPALTLLGDLANRYKPAGLASLGPLSSRERSGSLAGACRELALCRGNASLCRSGACVAMRAAGWTPMRGLARPSTEVVEACFALLVWVLGFGFWVRLR
jgi:hypothetical protein